MKNEMITQLILAAIITCGSVAASISLAKRGGPQSVWLWCDMISLCAW